MMCVVVVYCFVVFLFFFFFKQKTAYEMRISDWSSDVCSSDLFPGFAAAEVLYGDKGEVVGVATGDMGIGRDGEHKASYTPGVELRGKYTLIAEGVRGSLAKELQAKFRLRDGAGPAKFGIGIKALWQIDPATTKPGLVIPTPAWPLAALTPGGRFLYHP